MTLTRWIVGKWWRMWSLRNGWFPFRRLRLLSESGRWGDWCWGTMGWTLLAVLQWHADLHRFVSHRARMSSLLLGDCHRSKGDC